MPLTTPVVVEEVVFTREKMTTQLMSEVYKEEIMKHPEEDFDYYEQRENEHYTNHHRLAKELKEEGIVPTLPILLVPGFASSSLKVEQGYKRWENKRIWISLHKLGLRKFKHTVGKALHRQSSQPQDILGSEIRDEAHHESLATKLDGSVRQVAADVTGTSKMKRKWIEHMCLQEDGISDPPGVKVRPYTGLEAISYLDPKRITKRLSHVFAPLITFLTELGYDEQNLQAAPYDWRIPLHHLETRDGYFTQLVKMIETLHHYNGRPVLIIAHSMGNRVVQYFFNWLKWTRGETDATAWIKCYVHTFFAVGPPWLGAPKIGRALISGEAMGLDHFLFGKERLRLARSCGSIGCLLPIERSKFVMNEIESFYYLKKKGEDQFQPCPLKDLLQSCDAQRTVECVDKNFMNNPLYGSRSEDQPMSILEAPPVERLFALYGVGLDTELSYYYEQKK
eukprot:TRINITY_DN9597_c0_g1_i3.p1 TRINITY_DN9597_c0_g1~~TRINITY_DN9597_c0_g1_i3.p1  ORF type:complete len:451 (+),score=106.59 TRINITY_DN9597_c0_g1_i3:83-1435(+)